MIDAESMVIGLVELMEHAHVALCHGGSGENYFLEKHFVDVL